MAENDFEEVRLVLFAYLDANFVERNLEATLAFLTPNISGFGTGADEIAINKEDFEKLFIRDFAEAPNPIDYQVTDLDIHVHAETALTASQINIRTIILNQELKLNNIRLSIFFVRQDGIWWMEHLHISFPTQVHAGDEVVAFDVGVYPDGSKGRDNFSFAEVCRKLTEVRSPVRGVFLR